MGQVVYPGGMDARYDRLLLLTNPHLSLSLTHKPSVRTISGDSLAWNIWEDYSLRDGSEGSFKVLDPRLQTGFNTGYPRGYNDGPAWWGKGASLVLSAGFSGHYKTLSYTFAPVLWTSRNASYDLADSLWQKHRFSYQFEERIDWVQRFGDGAYAALHPGQSEVRLTVGNGTLGFSSQNFTWGPGLLNHILMSNSGSGFYHVDLGTYRPQPTAIGALELKMFWGWMDSSDYYRLEPDNHRRFVSGLALGYAPAFVEGLTASLHRIMYKDASDLDLRDVVQLLYRYSPQEDTLHGFKINDLLDQIASLAVDWRFPEVGFETYFEYALNDFIGSPRRILTETEHTRAYTLGMLKTFPLRRDRMILLSLEHTSLSLPKTLFYRSAPTYYVHVVIEAGFTHQGQIVGAGIGPGGTSDYLGLTYFHERGSLRFDVQRIRFNEDYFQRFVQNSSAHDTELTFGLTGQRFFDRVDVSAAMLFSHRFNVYYQEARDLSNVHVNLGVRVKL